jgi:hypothetical protein
VSNANIWLVFSDESFPADQGRSAKLNLFYIEHLSGEDFSLHLTSICALRNPSNVIAEPLNQPFYPSEKGDNPQWHHGPVPGPMPPQTPDHAVANLVLLAVQPPERRWWRWAVAA